MTEENEIISVAKLIEADVNESIVDDLACWLRRLRKANGQWGCMHKTGSGVSVWIKSRLRELGRLPPCGGLSEDMDIRIAVELHFHPWDTEKYGACFDTASTLCEKLLSGEQRSPLMRLIDAQPIDATASRVSQQFGDVCPYCRQAFRNPNALTLHVKERHKDEFINERAQR